jgi:hypothetical protein
MTGEKRWLQVPLGPEDFEPDGRVGGLPCGSPIGTYTTRS